MQKSEIADSVSLLTGCTAIFDFYTAKAVQPTNAKHLAVAAWRRQERCKFACMSLIFTSEQFGESQARKVFDDLLGFRSLRDNYGDVLD